MYLYGFKLITVCAIEIKISDRQKLEQKKSSIALIFQCKYVTVLQITTIILWIVSVINKQLQAQSQVVGLSWIKQCFS